MKPTEFEIEKALNVVRDLIPFGFHEAINGCFNDFCNNAAEYAEKNHLSFACGASKFCVIDEESEWVIKISFDCSYDVEGEDMEVDYCKRELYNYKKACGAGLEKYFAAIFKIGEVDGVEIYLQEKLEVNDSVEDDVNQIFCDYVHSLDEDYYNEIEDEDERNSAIWEGVYDMDEGERIEAIFGYIKELINFIENNDINDLHCGNFGYRGSELVIMDYSGWNVYSIEEQ